MEATIGTLMAKDGATTEPRVPTWLFINLNQNDYFKIAIYKIKGQIISGMDLVYAYWDCVCLCAYGLKIVTNCFFPSNIN